VELVDVLRRVVLEAMAEAGIAVPSLEATPSVELTPEASASEVTEDSSASAEPEAEPEAEAEPEPEAEPEAEAEPEPEADHSETPLADGESAGMEDEDATFTERGLNQDITLVRMGSMSCVNGEELRMILSIQNNSKCLTIRDACVLFSDLKDMVDQFDSKVRMLKDEKISRHVRSWHVFYARSILIATSGFAYAWLASTLHSWS
jgi:hypothetical protein